jgi:adenosine deaminase
MPVSTNTPRAELHTHLGGAVDPPILWSIAHRQGIRLPTKDYWEFEAMITMGPRDRNRGLKRKRWVAKSNNSTEPRRGDTQPKTLLGS